jgi:hypothetical protein
MVVTAPKEGGSANCTWIIVLEYHGNKGRHEVWREEKESDKDTLCQLKHKHLAKQALEQFGDLNIRGQEIWTVKYADHLVLVANNETVLQGMTDRLNENGEILWNGKERGRN